MNFQDIGTVGIIGIILLTFASIGFCKGLIRTLLAILCLVIAGYVAIWGQEHAHELTGSWVKNPGPWLSWGIGIIAGLIAFILCRYLLHFLVNPFNSSKTGRRIGFGFPAALITFCLGAAFIWLLLSGIRCGGSLAEIEDTQFKLHEGDDNSSTDDRIHRYTTPLLLRAKRALDTSSAGKWHQLTDPFHSPEKITLCKILIFYHHTPSRHRMLKIPALNALLNQASLIDLAHRDEIKKAVVSQHPGELFFAQAVSNALSNQTLLVPLRKVTSDDLSSLVPD